MPPHANILLSPSRKLKRTREEVEEAEREAREFKAARAKWEKEGKRKAAVADRTGACVVVVVVVAATVVVLAGRATAVGRFPLAATVAARCQTAG